MAKPSLSWLNCPTGRPYQESHIDATATLTIAGWSGGSQTVTVVNMTATSTVIVSAADSASADAWGEFGIWPGAQGTNTATFTCKSTPTAAVNLVFVILN